MALKIRLRRMGRKNAPTYRIVVAESSMPRDGRIITSIGHYNPRTEPLTLSVDREKALHWLSQGAVPTDTTKALLKRAGIFRPEEEQGTIANAASVAADGAKRAATAARGAAGRMAGLVENAAEKVSEAASSIRDAVAGGGEPEQPSAPEPSAEASEPSAEASEAEAAVGMEGESSEEQKA